MPATMPRTVALAFRLFANRIIGLFRMIG